ncbi:MAG: substrate-binding domain-containing protein, partial [Pseudoalteromonas shioyasakiensis]
LTTIAQPVEEMTQQAVKQLITHIGDPQESPYQVTLEAKLITRESTAAIK